MRDLQMQPLVILESFKKNNKQNRAIFKNLLDNLSKSNDYDVDSKFEYFYNKNFRNIKLLHLLFYKEGCGIQERQKIYSNRKRQILSLFKSINKNNNFNFSIIKKIFKRINWVIIK